MAENTNRVLSKDNIRSLMNILTPVASKCSALGLQLGLEDWQIKNIEKNNRHECESQLQAILVERLNQDQPLTCRDLVAALSSDSVRETRVAHQIESHYSTSQSLLSTPQQERPNVSVALSEASLPPSSSQLPSQQNPPLPRPSTNPPYPTYQPTHYSPPPQLAISWVPPPPISHGFHHSDPQYPNQSLKYSTSPYHTMQLPTFPHHYTAHQCITHVDIPVVPGTTNPSRPPVPTPANPTLPSASPQVSRVADLQPPPGPYIFHQQQPSPHFFQQPIPHLMYQGPTYNPYPYHLLPQQSVVYPRIPYSPASLPHPYITPPHAPIQYGSPPQVVVSEDVNVRETGSPPPAKRPAESPVRHSHHQSQHLPSQHLSTSQRKPPLVNQFIDYMRTVYKSSEVEKDTHVVKWPPTPSEIYINLMSIDRFETGKRDEVTEAMVRCGDVDVVYGEKRPINFKEIATGVPDIGGKRVVLVGGAPGVGKSTFAWEYCRRWERGEVAQQYQLVLLLRLRDEGMSKAHTLKDLIYHPSEDVRQAVRIELEQSLGSKILVILEGFDELPEACRTPESIFLRLIHGELLPLATVIVTSRPWAIGSFFERYKHRLLKHIEILGFTSEQISKYVKSVLSENEAKDLESYVKNHPQIRGCMYIPLNSAIVVTVYQDRQASGHPLPTTLTELYTALAQILLVRYLQGHPELEKGNECIGIFKDLNVPNRVKRSFTELCKLAYKGIAADQEYDDEVQLIFKESELPDNFDNLGFMDSVTELYLTRGTVSSHNFLHLTFQEFFAAVHISTMSPAEQLKHFARHNRVGRLKVVLRFLAGITKMSCFSGNNVYYNKGLIPIWNFELLNWIFESRSDDVTALLNEAIHAMPDTELLKIEFFFSKLMLPMDYFSLGYCMVHSQCQWVLNLTEVWDIDTEMLVAGASLKSDTQSRVVGIEQVMDDNYDVNNHCISSIFVGLKNILHLHELSLYVTIPCSDIPWPDLSSLRVLTLAITDNAPQKLALDTLLPPLTLESLSLDGHACDDEDDYPSSCEFHVPIENYIRTTTLKHLTLRMIPVSEEGMEIIARALASNPLSLETFELIGNFALSDKAAELLVQFISNSTTLRYLDVSLCKFRVGGLRLLAQALQHNCTLEKQLMMLDVTFDDGKDISDLKEVINAYSCMKRAMGLKWEIAFTVDSLYPQSDGRAEKSSED